MPHKQQDLSPGKKRMLASLRANPGQITEELAASASLPAKTVRKYVREFEVVGLLHQSHWQPDQNVTGKFRRGFSAGPLVGKPPELPKGAKIKGSSGRPKKPADSSSKLEYIAILRALMGNNPIK